ncbi:MAG: epoxide hydrolase, partial [Vulcanimicrobiaceae bacterium]
MFNPLVAYAERSGSMTQVAEQAPSGATAVRPFPKLNVPEAELTELRRRINATRWHTRELVADD